MESVCRAALAMMFTDCPIYVKYDQKRGEQYAKVWYATALETENWRVGKFATAPAFWRPLSVVVFMLRVGG